MARAFPRSHERGPIEAWCARLAARIVESFPRSHERGPIEATRRNRRPTCGPCFRVLMNAAPLKQIVTKGVGGDPGGFPRSHERGPIEAIATSRRTRRPPTVSAFS